jgi:phage-related protein
MEMMTPIIKPVVWIGSSRAHITSFPEKVKDAIGYALYIAQRGGKHSDAKPLLGFGGAGILEIVEDHAGDTYRAVYTVRLAGRNTCCMCSRRSQRPASRHPKL